MQADSRAATWAGRIAVLGLFAAVGAVFVARTEERRGTGSAAGPRSVRILDPEMRPVPGVGLWREGRHGADSAFTGADGVATAVLPAGESLSFFDGLGVREVTPAADPTPVIVRGFPVLEVETVHALTGDPIEVDGVRADEADLVRTDVGRWRGARVPFFDDGWADLKIDVDPPPGFGCLRPFAIRPKVATRARMLRVVVPVYPARDVALRVVDPAGRPVRGAVARSFELSHGPFGDHDAEGSFVSGSPEPSDAAGLLVVRDFPAIPLHRAWFEVGTDRDPFSGTRAWIGRIPIDAQGSGEPRTVVLPGSDDFFYRFGANGLGARTDDGARDRATHRFAVRALHRDGTPAARVWLSLHGDSRAGVQYATTDPDGRAWFRIESPGRRTAFVNSFGFLPTELVFEARPRGEVVLRESEPRRVRVRVTDPEGKPVPSAWVSVDFVAQIAGDVQFATPRTDRDGWITLDVAQSIEGFLWWPQYIATLGAAVGRAHSEREEVHIVLTDPDSRHREEKK